MPNLKLTDFLLLPKLKLQHFEYNQDAALVTYHCSVKGRKNFCPHCGLETSTVHSYRSVTIKDAPHGMKAKVLKIKKRRFRCEGMGCKKVFTEQIDGIKPRARLTERLARDILYVSDRFANLKAVKEHTRVATGTIYKKHYAQLELKWRERKNDPWPSTIGIDEHSFSRNKERGHREFVTMVVDYNNNRLKRFYPLELSANLSGDSPTSLGARE